MAFTYPYREQDHDICRTQKRFTIEFEGKGTIDDSPATTLYLKRSHKGNQHFYIPEGTVIYARLRAVVSNTTDAYDAAATPDSIEHIAGDYIIYRDVSGNVTVAIDPATPQTEEIATVVPTAQTTAQAVEMVVAVVATPDATAVLVRAFLNCICVYEFGVENMPTGAAATSATIT